MNEKNLLEGIGISVDLVVFSTDSRDDSRDGDEDANVDLQNEEEHGLVRKASADKRNRK